MSKQDKPQQEQAPQVSKAEVLKINAEKIKATKKGKVILK
jgi:hypothetical protein